jgi:27-O-demethylrifamycin SV methyltransferase
MSIAQHYDAVTRAWSLVMGGDLHWGLFETGIEDLPTATTQLTDRMAELLRLGPEDVVVDVGCGTGGPALHIARTYGVGVLGITLSEVGASIASERARSAGLEDRVRFSVADAQATHLKSETFTRAWVMESSHLMPDKEAMLGEAHRVLVPGGRLALCDLIAPRELTMQEVLTRSREYALLARVFGKAKMERLETYCALAEHVGFSTPTIVDVTHQARPTVAAWRRNLEGHVDTISELMGRTRHAEFLSACDVLEDHIDSGVLGYGMMVAQKVTG